MPRLSLAIISIALTSCVSTSNSTLISRYEVLEKHVNETVTLSGFWSNQHEATGVYFGKRRYFEGPESCVAVDVAINSPHASRVKLTGTFQKTTCGTELICITVCQPYVLTNVQRIK